MRRRPIARSVIAAAVAACALLIAPVHVAPAQADPCPDVDVVFARGTNEPPPLGPVGDVFVAALRPLVGDKSVGVYGVNYPANMDFNLAIDGIRDAAAHVSDMAKTCPKTKMVLSGFSQGAAVMGFVTADAVPDGVPQDVLAQGLPKPLPSEVADHVAAVVLFGTPSDRFMDSIGMPPIVIGPRYKAKTLELCADGDVICSDQGDFGAHGLYTVNGLPNQGAQYAASKL
ncbi:MAG TPA: cutinase family protein [Mycobacterium sp.]|nr:cutinase family protein [Mycobacterium sp.]